MKRHRIYSCGWLAGSILTCFCPVKAQELVPCLIFTGNSDTEYCIDIARQNRISFGDEGMSVGSFAQSNDAEITLSYSMYNHIAIGNANPTQSSAVDIVEVRDSSKLVYQPETKVLVLEAASDAPFTIGIFGLNGTLIATSTMYAGQSLPVAALPPGAYFAIGSNEVTKISLKFIMH